MNAIARLKYDLEHNTRHITQDGREMVAVAREDIIETLGFLAWLIEKEPLCVESGKCYGDTKTNAWRAWIWPGRPAVMPYEDEVQGPTKFTALYALWLCAKGDVR